MLFICYMLPLMWYVYLHFLRQKKISKTFFFSLVSEDTKQSLKLFMFLNFATFPTDKKFGSHKILYLSLH